MPVLKSPWPEVRGIFTGGCVERGEGSSFRALVHAHTQKSDPWQGWICVWAARRVGLVNDDVVVKPSRLLAHELAHMLTGHGHDDVWPRKMKELGQPIPERYKKHSRSVPTPGMTKNRRRKQ